MNENRYQEQAERLSKAEIEHWYIDLNESNLIPKLTGRGAKLLSAPRGAGKSMLLRKVFYHCIDSNGQPFPVYTNYSHYIKVDFASHNRPDYLITFRKWILGKILLSAFDTLKDLNITSFKSIELPCSIADLKKFVLSLEGGTYTPFDFQISPEQTCEILEEMCQEASRARVILLLDDAAHAFTPELQREFFDLFRALNKLHISPKAAVYPGLTSYGAKFHVGHDAEVISLGMKPENENYAESMIKILKKRLTSEEYTRLIKIEGLLETLSYAASGIPRALIVMARYCIQGNDESSRGNKKIHDGWEAISLWNDYLWNLYDSISAKIPRYKEYISCGKDLYFQILNQVKTYNNALPDQKTIYVAIEDTNSPRYDAIIQYLEYAGLLFPRPNISRGSRGVYRRYLPHIGMLIDQRAIQSGHRSYKQISNTLYNTSNLFPQLKYNSLVDGKLDERCLLDLPPCQNCGTARPFSEAKFCFSCGKELPEVSMYSELIRQPIRLLPLPPKKLQTMEESGLFSSIGDLLESNAAHRLQTLKGIHRKWAEKIIQVAEEFSMA